MEVPQQWDNVFESVDLNGAVQAADMKVVTAAIMAGDTGSWLKVRPVIPKDVDHRFLAKVALAIGYKLMGTPFLESADGKTLHRGFREANSTKRPNIPVFGAGYMNPLGLGEAETVLRWTGAWVLFFFKD